MQQKRNVSVAVQHHPAEHHELWAWRPDADEICPELAAIERRAAQARVRRRPRRLIDDVIGMRLRCLEHQIAASPPDSRSPLALFPGTPPLLIPACDPDHRGQKVVGGSQLYPARLPLRSDCCPESRSFRRTSSDASDHLRLLAQHCA